MGNGLFRSRKRTAFSRSKSFQASKAASWWDGRERNWVMEAWDLLRPMSEGKWWAWAALSELARDFEAASTRLALLIFSEIGLEKRLRILPQDADGVYRAYNLELVLAPHDKIHLKTRMSEEMLSAQALWRARPTQLVPPLLFIIDFQGSRCLVRGVPPKRTKVVFGPGARQVPRAITLEVARLGKNLNLKTHHVPAGMVSELGSEEQMLHGFETIFSSDTAVQAGQNGVQFIAKLSSIFPLELERKRKDKVRKKLEESESESSEGEAPVEEDSDEEEELDMKFTTAMHVRAWIEDIDFKKLTRKQLRELVERRDAGEEIEIPPEVEELLQSKSERRLKRITDMVDGQYKSKRLVRGERHLRPELVMAQEVALSADAHEPWNPLGVRKGSEDAKEVYLATERIARSVIPQLAMELDNRTRQGEVDWTREKLRREMHSRGIPMRRLGEVLANTREEGMRVQVLTEMAVRVCKGILRRRMWAATEESRGHSQQPCCDAVAEFLLLVFGSHADAQHFWDGMQSLLEAKYVGFDNLTPDQRSMMGQWEKSAEAITNPETRREHAELKQIIRRLGKDVDEAVVKRFDIVDSHLRRNIDREKEFRIKIDERFRHVKEQLDLELLIGGVLQACGVRTMHRTPAGLLEDCMRGILAPTDVVSISHVTRSLGLAETSEAIQTLLRTKEEHEGRRERDLDNAVLMLRNLISANPHDWMLLSFYADALVLRLDVSEKEERLGDLRLAFDCYMQCVNLSSTAHRHLLEAGDVLYEILSIKPDNDAEERFLAVCREKKLTETDPHGYQRHLSSWIQLLLEAFRNSLGKRTLRLGELAGSLLLKLFEHEGQGERSVEEVLKDKGLEWAAGLDMMELVAVLEVGRQVAHIGYVTDQQEKKRSWLPMNRRRRKQGKKAIGRTLDITDAPYISDKALERLLLLSQSLESFSAKECLAVNSQTVEALMRYHGHSLVELHLTRCTKVDSESLLRLASQCELLTSLQLCESANLVTNDFLEATCPYLKNLISLDISGAVNLGNAGVKSIGAHCAELRSISLAGIPYIDDVGFIHIVRKCQKIKKLNLRGCSGITGRAVVEMAMRTHCLWAPRKRCWTRPGEGQVIVRGTEEGANRFVDEDEDEGEDDDEDEEGEGRLTIEEEMEADEPEDYDQTKFLGRQEIMELSHKLYGHTFDWENIKTIFFELDGVSGVQLLKHRIRVERLTDYMLNNTDYQLPLIDIRRCSRTVDALFQVFAQKRKPPAKFGKALEDSTPEPHGMEPDEFLLLVRHLNIVPAYLPTVDVIHIYSVIMERANALWKQEQEAAELASGNLTLWQDKTEMYIGEFRTCFEAVAKNLSVSPKDLSRFSREWIHSPHIPRDQIAFRIPFAGPLVSIRTDAVKSYRRSEVALQLYVGAIKVSTDTLEQLEEPSISFVSLHLKVITSWGPEYISEKHKNFTTEVHAVQLKASIMNQEYWLMEFDEHIDMSVPSFSDQREFDRAAITIQLVLTAFDAKKMQIAKAKAKGKSFRTFSIASVTMALPSYMDTDARIQWLAFSQFQGMKKKSGPEEEDEAPKTEEELVEEEFNLLKMPPQMRLQYRVLGTSSYKLYREKLKNQRSLQSRQEWDRWTEGVKDKLKPGYLRRKVENRAQQAVEMTTERIINMMFNEFDIFEHARRFELLDLSHTNVHSACLQELVSSFDGLRTLSLQNCTAVAGSRLERVAQRTKSLTHLDVKGCTKMPERAVNDLTRRCPFLSYVDLSVVDAVFDSTLENLAKCKNLTVLKISGCLNIPETGFRSLLECRCLTELKIGGCAQIHEKAFMASVGHLSGLTGLDISYMNCVTDESLDLVLRSNRQLTSLNVSHNNELTNNALLSLSRYGQRLRKLKMSGNENFSDRGAEFVFFKCEALQKLSLAQDIGLTDRILETLATQGGDLQELDLCGCVGTTVRARSQLMAALPYTHVYQDTVDSKEKGSTQQWGSWRERMGVREDVDHGVASEDGTPRLEEAEDMMPHEANQA